MKKISVKHFSFMERAEKLNSVLETLINDACPNGYHFKQLTIGQLQDNYNSFYESGIIIYEED